jgi:hypothetical protein
MGDITKRYEQCWKRCKSIKLQEQELLAARHAIVDAMIALWLVALAIMMAGYGIPRLPLEIVFGPCSTWFLIGWIRPIGEAGAVAIFGDSDMTVLQAFLKSKATAAARLKYNIFWAYSEFWIIDCEWNNARRKAINCLNECRCGRDKEIRDSLLSKCGWYVEPSSMCTSGGGLKLKCMLEMSDCEHEDNPWKARWRNYKLTGGMLNWNVIDLNVRYNLTRPYHLIWDLLVGI